jgi:hypothetical protein
MKAGAMDPCPLPHDKAVITKNLERHNRNGEQKYYYQRTGQRMRFSAFIVKHMELQRERAQLGSYGV